MIATEPSAPIVEVSFSADGDAVAADHGFSLFSAISRVWPGVHANPNVAILPIQGLPSGDRMLSLKGNSRLTLRLPADQLPAALAFAGKTLQVGSNRMLLGVPTVRLLRPTPSLRSRLVVIKGFTDPEEFLAAARRDLVAVAPTGVLSLEQVRSDTALERRSARAAGQPIRRTIHIHGKQIVGFAVRVDGLSDVDSIALQSHGLGGRRRFGCGVFVAIIPNRSRA